METWECIREHITGLTAGLDDATEWNITQAITPRQGGLECAIRCALHGLYGICQDGYDGRKANDLDICGASADEAMRLFVANAIRVGQIRVPAQWKPAAELGMARQGGPAGIKNSGNSCYASAVLQGWAACRVEHEPRGGRVRHVVAGAIE